MSWSDPSRRFASSARSRRSWRRNSARRAVWPGSAVDPDLASSRRRSSIRVNSRTNSRMFLWDRSAPGSLREPDTSSDYV